MRLWQPMLLRMAAGTTLPTPYATALHATARNKSPSTGKSLKPRATKKRKSDELREATLDGAVKHTKPFTSHKRRTTKAARASDKRLETLKTPHDESSLEDSVIVIDERPLALEKSVPRRRSWTPPKEDCNSQKASSDLEYYASKDGHSNTSGRGLGALSSKYGYSQNITAEQVTRRLQNATQQTTRRKIELGYAPPNSVTQLDLDTKPRPKSKPKKKPRTITGKATELYRQEFGIPDEALAHADENNEVGNARRPRKGKNALINTLPLSPLLSPASARRVFESQDRIFGTSSQLVHEDSPSTITNLQTALKLSLETVSESSASPTDLSGSTSQSSRHQSVIGLLPSSKKLWEAASRDLNGETLMPKVIDLTDSPHGISGLNLCPTPAIQSPMIAVATTSNQLHTYPEHPQLETSERRPSMLPVSVAESLSTPELETLGLGDPIEAMSVNPHSGQKEVMPDYTQWSDSDLKAAIKSYGFKAMRNRKNMIVRLKECWHSLHSNSQSVLEVTNATESPSGLQAPSPPSVSGQKMASRKPKAFVSKPIRALENELTLDTASIQTQTSCGRDRLFAAIHEAILTSPCTSDPKNLSWHEKILLYDPIVIEDLTRWLNQGQLTRVGIDDEVAPTLVRDWCESRSICCLWKLNLRGGVRSRF